MIEKIELSGGQLLNKEAADKLNELIEASNRQDAVIIDLIHQSGRTLTAGQMQHLVDKLDGKY